MKINLEDKFGLFKEHWSPKVLASFNNQELKIAKVKGEFVWHNHSDEDELFMVIKGQLGIELEDRTIQLNTGEIFIVPKGVQHKPFAEEECWILLVEPQSTKHTGEKVLPISQQNKEYL